MRLFIDRQHFIQAAKAGTFSEIIEPILDKLELNCQDTPAGLSAGYGGRLIKVDITARALGACNSALQTDYARTQATQRLETPCTKHKWGLHQNSPCASK